MSELKCTLSDQELIKNCKEWISELCRTAGSAWKLSVPVDFNRDPDMLFSELIKRFSNPDPVKAQMLEALITIYKNNPKQGWLKDIIESATGQPIDEVMK